MLLGEQESTFRRCSFHQRPKEANGGQTMENVEGICFWSICKIFSDYRCPKEDASMGARLEMEFAQSTDL
jgi:hypothetical protein